MATEIERKFLLRSEDWRRQVRDHRDYVQGYLQLEQRSSIRVRSDGEHAWLNIKGTTLGASRAEFEYEIPLADAKTMLQTLCVQPLISKRRHHVPYGGHVFEIDEFHGANAGLIVAEIELSHPDEPFERPNWLGREVTDQPRYYNSRLVLHPYSQWSAQEREA